MTTMLLILAKQSNLYFKPIIQDHVSESKVKMTGDMDYSRYK